MRKTNIELKVLVVSRNLMMMMMLTKAMASSNYNIISIIVLTFDPIIIWFK